MAAPRQAWQGAGEADERALHPDTEAIGVGGERKEEGERGREGKRKRGKEGETERLAWTLETSKLTLQ